VLTALTQLASITDIANANTFIGAGLVGVALIIFAETGLLLGFFLPGDTLLFLAGAYTAAHAKAADGSTPPHLNFALTLIVCIIAAIAGAQVGHFLGAKAGPRLFDKPDSRFFNREYVERTEKLFERFGVGRGIVLARFAPIVRTFMNPFCGIVQVPAKRFFVFNAIGGVIWVSLILTLGRLLGSKINIDKYIVPIFVVIILGSVVSLVLENRRAGRARAARAARDETPVA
jgi:membrane-associated protein